MGEPLPTNMSANVIRRHRIYSDQTRLLDYSSLTDMCGLSNKYAWPAIY